MNKKALIVGINYPGTAHELRGCVNDANLIKSVITDHYGFTDVRMLLDNDATTANMIAELEKLVADTVPGDVVYFHYSGHGSQMYDTHGDEADGLDEIICPVDLDWKTKVIRDDDLKRIFDKVPNGVNLTVTLDCCNSGGGLDQDNQYQSLGEAREAIAGGVQKGAGRFLPPPEPAEQALQTEAYLGFKPKALSRDVDATGLLISGCQAHQTSADAYINGGYIGACTYVLADTLKNAQYDMNYKDLVDSMNRQLADYGFTQRPELNGPELLFGRTFLEADFDSIGSGVTEPDVEVPVEAVEPIVETAPVAEVPEDNKKKKKIGLIIAGVLAIAAVIYFSL